MIKITSPEIQEFEIRHLARLRALAPECMVLLKKNGDFPLCAPGKIALYGSGARQTVKGGTGSGDINVRHFVTVEEGLEKAGFTIVTKPWLDAYDALRSASREHFYDDIIAQAKAEGKPAFIVGLGKTPPEPRYAFSLVDEGDVCVYVLARNSGEGADRLCAEGDYQLTDDETRDILICANKYEKFLLVLNVGGAVDISPVLDKVDNILLLSQLGSITGDAFADVLLGRAYPSGKLTSTWARAKDIPMIGNFAEIDDTHYREGVFVGYRYFDIAGIQPLFSFGYGLGYADFIVKVKEFKVENGLIGIIVTVKNTSRFPGKEAVLLYYSAPDGKLKKPLRELGAYQKTGELRNGEAQELTLTLPVENMASWDTERAAWVLEKGDYVVYIGALPVGIVELAEDTVTQKLAHVGGCSDFEDWQPSVMRKVPTNVPRILVKSVKTGHFDRERMNGEPLVPPNLTGFNDEELARACTGKFKEAQGVAAIIGNTSYSVAGAGGESADILQEKGFGKMVLADGPAGLRLTTSYVELPEGALGLDAGSFESIIRLFSEPLQKLILAKSAEAREAAKKHAVYYHYASAIPIGTALAQAWNPDLSRACGDIVGEEMELFGVNVWLAPALNIHRNPLCGRNFEYYSEDPIVSGKTAASITAGVQAHYHCAVTLKHFCCNNQETNRFGSNSILSERALREIYLKGFEICVKESAPKALMSSYNLLNGVHTANRKDLLTDVLRGEWGFNGVVMTDWGTTGTGLNFGQYGASSPALCIKAGNDLIMSGNQGDVDGILAGLENELTREELELCAGRVTAMAKKLSE